MKPYLKTILIISSIILLLGLSFGIMKFLISLKSEIEVKEPEKKTRFVKAKSVEYREINSGIKQTGRVVSQTKIDITTEVRGKIEKGSVNLKKGERFKKGDILFRVYNTDAVLTIKAQKSRFLNSIAALLPDFKIDFPQSYTLWYDFFQKIDINNALPDFPELNSGKEKIFLASRNILSDYYTIKSQEVILSKYIITAPFSGSFTEVFAEIGTVANPGVKIATLIKADDLEIEVPIEPQNAMFIKPGDPVNVSSADGQKKYKAKVVRKADFVEEKTQSISVFVGIEGNTEDVFQGEYLLAEFEGIIIKDADEINRNAVFNFNEVYVVEGGQLKKKIINILKVNETTYIFNGLERGEQIVSEPLINAGEGLSVEISTSK